MILPNPMQSQLKMPSNVTPGRSRKEKSSRQKSTKVVGPKWSVTKKKDGDAKRNNNAKAVRSRWRGLPT